MAKKKETYPDFPYAELEFTRPADNLIQMIEQFIIRHTGDKPTRSAVLELCNRVLENRK